MMDVTPGACSASGYRARSRVDPRVFHQRGVNDQPVITNSQPSSIMPSTANSKKQIMFSRKAYRADYVCHIRTARYQARPFVYHSVVHFAGIIISFIMRLYDSASQVRLELFDGIFVEHDITHDENTRGLRLTRLFRLGQRDGLKRADDVVGAFRGEKGFVKPRTEVPVVALVIFVAIKSPDAAHDDEAADAIVPEIADIMETQVRARVRSLETGVIINHQLWQADDLFARLHFDFAGGGGVIAQRAEFPFRVDDAAVIRRQFGFRYLSHKRRFFSDLNKRRGNCR